MTRLLEEIPSTAASTGSWPSRGRGSSDRQTVTKPAVKASASSRRSRTPFYRRRWVRYLLLATGGAGDRALRRSSRYYYVQFSRQIEARLHGERDRVLPRVFARPLDLWKGQALGLAQLVDRLNDLGYAQRAQPEKPGEFGVRQASVLIVPRGGDHPGQMVRAVFEEPKARPVSAAATSAPAAGPAAADCRAVGRGHRDRSASRSIRRC